MRNTYKILSVMIMKRLITLGAQIKLGRPNFNLICKLGRPNLKLGRPNLFRSADLASSGRSNNFF